MNKFKVFMFMIWLVESLLVVGQQVITTVTSESVVTWVTETLTLQSQSVVLATLSSEKTVPFTTIKPSYPSYTTTATISSYAIVASTEVTTLADTSTPSSATHVRTTFTTLTSPTAGATPSGNVTVTQNSPKDTTAIVAGSLGGLLGVLLLLLIFYVRKKLSHRQANNEQDVRMNRIKDSWLPKVFRRSQASSSPTSMQISTPVPLMAPQSPPRPARPASLTGSTVHAMSTSPALHRRNPSDNMQMTEDYHGAGLADQSRVAPEPLRYQTPPPNPRRPASSMYAQQPYTPTRHRGNDHPNNMNYSIDETIDSIRGSPGPSSSHPYRESLGTLELDYDDEYKESPQSRTRYEDRHAPFAVGPVPAWRRDEDEDDLDKLRRERQKALERLEGRRIRPDSEYD